MTGPVRVSVVIAAYNAARWIERVIDSVLAQTGLDGPLEVVVIDDGSRDRTAEIVAGTAGRDARVRLIRQANQGTAGAVTAGLRAARGEIVCLLSHDTYAAPDWLARVGAAFAADPAVGIVQGPILAARPIDAPIVHCTVVTAPSRSFPGVAIAYRGAALDQAGRYFPADLSRYGDDADLGWRIVEAGYTAAWLPDPTAYHEVVPRRFWKEVRAAAGVGAFAKLIGRHPEMRRQLRFGILWGSKYRYAKVGALHAALLALLLRRPRPAAALIGGAVGLAWYESLQANRAVRVGLRHKLFTLPVHQILGEVIASYALIIGSLRWRSPVL